MRKFIAILAALMVAAIPFASFAEGFGAQTAGKFTISDFRLTADGKDTDLSAAVLTGCIAVDGDDFAALLAVGPTDAPETLRIALKGEDGNYSATLGNAEQFMPYAVTVSQSDIQMLMQIAGFDAN